MFFPIISMTEIDCEGDCDTCNLCQTTRKIEEKEKKTLFRTFKEKIKKIKENFYGKLKRKKYLSY